MKAADKRLVRQGIVQNNPITFQVLGICSALAVTSKMYSALMMAFVLTFVLVFSSVTISFFRNLIPQRIRFIVQLIIISTFVVLADQFLQAFFYDVSKQLSIFVGLVITNCIVMGRAESFAMNHSVKKSFFDALGNGIGYSFILLLMGFLREIIGSGKMFNFQIVPYSFYEIGYKNCDLMNLAPGAFIILGCIIWAQKTVSKN